ncbi:flagellar FlbD family protein [Phycicoccus jejuensis]|uniref:flagellar FlbD family protein n=1 Tax=Phycicoccus jejuensis TaxID=367299 RepID=UPI00068E1116|nr:flagellar FlbD family protein [Phycicoccus jejuensis]
MTDGPSAGPPPSGAGPLACPSGDGTHDPAHDPADGPLAPAIPLVGTRPDLKSWARLPMGTPTRHGRRIQHTQDGPGPMIILTRRNGTRFGINPDLVERVDETPDTIVLLVTGSRYVVQETLDEVVSIMRESRASVLHAAEESGTGQPGSRPGAGRVALRAVRGLED